MTMAAGAQMQVGLELPAAAKGFAGAGAKGLFAAGAKGTSPNGAPATALFGAKLQALLGAMPKQLLASSKAQFVNKANVNEAGLAFATENSPIAISSKVSPNAMALEISPTAIAPETPAGFPAQNDSPSKIQPSAGIVDGNAAARPKVPVQMAAHEIAEPHAVDPGEVVNAGTQPAKVDPNVRTEKPKPQEPRAKKHDSEQVSTPAVAAAAIPPLSTPTFPSEKAIAIAAAPVHVTVSDRAPAIASSASFAIASTDESAVSRSTSATDTTAPSAPPVIPQVATPAGGGAIVSRPAHYEDVPDAPAQTFSGIVAVAPEHNEDAVPAAPPLQLSADGAQPLSQSAAQPRAETRTPLAERSAATVAPAKIVSEPIRNSALPVPAQARTSQNDRPNITMDVGSPNADAGALQAPPSPERLAPHEPISPANVSSRIAPQPSSTRQSSRISNSPTTPSARADADLVRGIDVANPATPAAHEGAATAPTIQPSHAATQPAAVPVHIAAATELRAPVVATSLIGPANNTVHAAEVRASGSNAIFSALDTTSAPAPTWLHADARRAEAGYLDPALGWVGVRAETSGASVHASIVPATADAAQTLGSHLPALSAYMAEQHGIATQVAMGAPEMGSAAQGHSQGMSREGTHEQSAQSQRGDESFSGTPLRGSHATANGIDFTPAQSIFRSGTTISLVA